jgi:UDP-2,3-diacylglucosamine hydrolase
MHLFISDLHLSEQRPEIIQLFLHFLQQTAPQAENLYILGDFFEMWLGDDDDTQLATTVIHALNALSRTGTHIFIMHGNRDFLLGEQFMRACQATLLTDPFKIDLYGTPTLLMHGDTLCSEDMQYQAFRQQVRDPQYQQAFLAKPLAERHAIAQQLRAMSKEQTSIKAESIMDVTPAEVTRVMQEYNITQLIHGHTHRPRIHLLELPNHQIGKRIVLGAWEDCGNQLMVTEDQCLLQDISLLH